MRKRYNPFFRLAMVALCVCIWLMPYRAQTQDNDSDRQTWVRYQELGALTNCDNAAINVAVTCGGTRGIRVQGYNALTLEIVYTRSAGTGWQFVLETCHEGQGTTNCTDAADWHQVATEVVGAGTVELDAGTIGHDTTVTDRLTWTIGINYRRVRLASFVARGTPDANDKATVNARIGFLPNF